MKKKTKLALSACIAGAVLAVSFALWWALPTYFLRQVSIEEIAGIEVFNGNDGNRFTITEKDDIAFLAETIRAVPMKKDQISLGMGTTYNLRFLNARGGTLDKFIIMTPSAIRQGPVFYGCSGQLQQAVQHLIQLERERFPHTPWLQGQN